MIRALALLLTLVVPGLAFGDTSLSAAAIADFRDKSRVWYTTQGTGSFDLSALADSNIVLHTSDHGPTSQWTVDLIGSFDKTTGACTWGWAITAYPHLPRAGAQAVLDHATAEGLNDLLEPTQTHDYFGCAHHLAHALVLGDAEAMHSFTLDGTTFTQDGTSYYFGFTAKEATS